MVTQIQINGCGGHYSYLLGLISVLQKKYNFDDVIFSSYSCGCIPALLCCLNMDIDIEFTLLNIPLLQELSKKYTKAFFNFIPYLKKHLLKRLNNKSSDIYKKANDRLFIHLTHFPSLKTYIVSRYNSNEDLVDACMASGNISLYNDSLLYKFRNMNFIDGGLNKDRYIHPSQKYIEIRSDKYRIIPFSFLYITTCIECSKKLFCQGKHDMNNNIMCI